MQTRRSVLLGSLGLLLAMLMSACGPASAVLPRVHIKPTIKPVDDHPVSVLTDHPTLETRFEVLTVTPGALTRGNLDVWVQRAGSARKLLVTIGGLDYKWLRRWQVAGDLVLLEVGTPPSKNPKSNEYLHVVLVANARTGKLLYQGPVALTTIAYLDPPYLVKAGPASILGRLKAVWLINVGRGVQDQVLFPASTVGMGEVKNGRIRYVERVNGKLVQRSMKIPRTGWKPFKNVSVLKVSPKKAGHHAAAGGSPAVSQAPTQS